MQASTQKVRAFLVAGAIATTFAPRPIDAAQIQKTYASFVEEDSPSQWLFPERAEGFAPDCVSCPCDASSTARNNTVGGYHDLHASFFDYVHDDSTVITDVKFDVHGRYKSGGGNFLANIRIDSRGVNQNMLRPGEFGDNSVCKWRFPDAYRNITSLTDWNVDPDVVNDVEIRVRRNLNQDVMYVNAFKVEVRTERPVLTLEPPLLDFGDVCVGESRSLSVRIRNDGEGFLEGHVPSGAIDDGFVVTAGSGSYHLGPGQWRDVTVAFSPTDEGQYLSSIAGDLDPLIGLPLAYEFEEIEVRGNGQSGNPTPNVTSYGFGEVAIGADSLATFLIQNGPCPSVIDVRLDDLTDDAFSVVSGGGVFIIPAGALHPVTVRFAPCRDDFFSGSLDLGPDLDFIDLSGLCNQSPCEVTGGDLSFGDVPVGESRTLSFAIRNRGCDPLGGMLRLVDGAPEFALVGSPDYFLDPGQEAAFSVMFAPTTDDLFFGTIETGCDDISVELDGFGVLVGECSVEPIDLTFPDTPLGEETQQTFAIHNGSNVPISGDVAFADSCPAFRFVDGSGPYTLPPGGRVLVTLAFRPCEDDVYFCDVLTGCDDDVLLDGEGIGDACRVAPVDLDFGDVPIGGAVEQSFTITNDSCAELSGVLSLDDPDDVFTLVPSVAAYSIPPGDSLTVAVTFTPADEDLSFGTVITGCFDDVELVGAGVATGGGAECPTEDLADHWGAAAEGATAITAVDHARVNVGESSVRFETDGGFDAWLWFPQERNAGADLSFLATLNLQVYAENPSPTGFQNASPWIRLGSAAGYFEYQTDSDLLNGAIDHWLAISVPVQGDGVWHRTVSGSPDLSQIDWIEIHADTWDYGFKLWIDGLTLDICGAPPVGAEESMAPTPNEVALSLPRPNPSSGPVALELDLPAEGPVRLDVVDVAGRRVVRLLDGTRPSGRHHLQWDGRDASGSRTAGGIYFVRPQTPERVVVQKIMRLAN